MTEIVLGYVYLTSLALALLCGGIRYRTAIRPLKVIVILLGCSLLTEWIALNAAIRFHNNMPVYAIFGLVQYVFYVRFFTSAVRLLQARRIRGWFIADGLLLGLLNLVVWQPITQPNTYFLAFEAMFVIICALLHAFQYLQQERHSASDRAGFRISMILAFFWTANFFSWAILDYVEASQTAIISFVSCMILLVNILTYLGIAVVLGFYSGARAKS